MWRSFFGEHHSRCVRCVKMTVTWSLLLGVLSFTYRAANNFTPADSKHDKTRCYQNNGLCKRIEPATVCVDKRGSTKKVFISFNCFVYCNMWMLNLASQIQNSRPYVTVFCVRVPYPNLAEAWFFFFSTDIIVFCLKWTTLWLGCNAPRSNSSLEIHKYVCIHFFSWLRNKEIKKFVSKRGRRLTSRNILNNENRS